MEEDELLELAEEGGDRTGEVAPGENKVLEVLEPGDGERNGAGEVGLLVEVQNPEVREVADGIWNPTWREAAREELEFGDTVGGLVAQDDVPADTAVGVGGPGGEHSGIAEVALDLEECLLVVRVAELSGGDQDAGEAY